VFLLATGLALGGLTVVGNASSAALPHVPLLATRAFAASSVTPLDDAGTARPLDLLDRQSLDVAAAAATSRVARASRTRHAPVAPQYVRPGVGYFSSGFGMRWGRLHEGIDLAGPYGSDIRALTDGVVIMAGQESGYGNVIKLAHPEGIETVYGHLSAIKVSPGQRVTAGQVIGLEGNTGHSTGPHLHFEIRIGGVAIDPVPWLRLHGVFV
ncbi:MAG: M23 family metallopeptidase, partial [Actinomycetota bacterium]|nr:M23 family metallopeptidase [Actinomycetota bacterium]